MPKPRGKSHTTLTETATEVVRVLERIDGVKMIAPGEIKTNSRKGASTRYVTIVFTAAGFELIITGQSVQKVAVHTSGAPQTVVSALTAHKRLQTFVFKFRDRKPGV